MLAKFDPYARSQNWHVRWSANFYQIHIQRRAANVPGSVDTIWHLSLQLPDAAVGKEAKFMDISELYV